MKKILLRLMEYGLKGVDTYTYNGSVWLIFTDTKQWVLELTSEKTLWYNYTFFKQLFCVATSDVTSQDKFITEWAEKNMIKPFYSTPGGHTNMETINDVIDNGVRETKSDDFNVSQRLSEDVIDYGVKETHHVDVMKFFDNKMEDTIQNGVKHTEIGWHQCNNIDDAIERGVKETNYDTSQYSEDVEEVIQHGIKEIYEIDWDVPNDVIDEVIYEGVIEIRDWNESIKGDLTLCVNNVIENGVKETKHANKYDSIGPVFKEGKINHIIDNGVKVSGTFVGGNRQKENIESVIGYGTKNPAD
jgi:hypothetical protein